MNNLITQLSSAMQKRQAKSRWTAQVVIALSFVVISLGYLIGGSISSAKAFTLPELLHPIYNPIHLTAPKFDETFRSPRVLTRSELSIEWSLDANDADGNPVDYSGWTVDVYYQKLDNDKTTDNSFLIADGLTANQTNRTGKYVWDVANSAVSSYTDPNPYDRRIVLLLKKPDGSLIGLAGTTKFLILYSDITYPENQTLSYGAEVEVTWVTNLPKSQAQNATLRIQTYHDANDDGVIDSSSHLTVRTGVDMTTGSMIWKVGHYWTGSKWAPLGRDVVLGSARLFLYPYGVTDRPSDWYYGFDHDYDFNDGDWQPVFIIADAVIGRVDLTPETATLVAGQNQQFTAKAYDQNGDLITQTASEFTWTVNGPGGDHQMVTPGLFNLTLAGTYTVTAAYGGKSDSSTVVVTPGTMQTVEIEYGLPQSGDGVVDGSSDPIKIMPNTEIAFSAKAYDSYRNVVDDDPTKFTWADTRTPDAPTENIFQQATLGIYHVQATYMSHYLSNVVNVEVVGGAISEIVILPTLPVGGSQDSGSGRYSIKAGIESPFLISARDANGNVLMDDPSNSDIVWTNIDRPNGVFYKTVANLIDGYVVTATYGGVTSNSVTMLVGPSTIERVTLAPEQVYMPLPAGGSLPFTATAFDQWNNSWESNVNPERFNWAWRLQGETTWHNVFEDVPFVFTQSTPGTYEVVGTYAFFDNIVPSNATIVPVSSTALSGVYSSRIFDLDAGETIATSVKSFGQIVAVYGVPAGSNVSFGIKFYTADGAAIGSQPYYDLAIAESGGAGFDLGNWLASEHGDWINRIGKTQFVIIMGTTNYLDNDQMPWVESLSLNYELNAGEVGLINFTGETSQSAAQGASVTYDLVALPLPGTGAGSVQALLEVDWNGTEAGNGVEPSGMIVQFLIDSNNDGTDELVNDAATIWEFWLDETNANYRPSGYPFKLKLTSDTSTAPADYTFNLVGSVVGDATRTLRRTANPGVLTVTGGSGGEGDIALAFVSGSGESFRPGDTASYVIKVTSTNEFSAPVTLNTNIADQVSGVSTPTWVPASRIVTPPANGDTWATMSIDIDATADNQSNIQFTVTATANDGAVTDSITGTITIDDNAPERPAITIHAHVPMQTVRSSTQPLFYFRLYADNATGRADFTYQELDILPARFDEDDIEIAIPSGLVLDGQEYSGYIKSTRHLWAASIGSFTVDASATDQSYDITFPTLAAGNVGPVPAAAEFLEDDVINSIDWTTWLSEAAGVWTSLFADFDNSGKVNTPDLSYILGDYGANWSKEGALELRWPQS